MKREVKDLKILVCDSIEKAILECINMLRDLGEKAKSIIVYDKSALEEIKHSFYYEPISSSIFGVKIHSHVPKRSSLVVQGEKERIEVIYR